MKSLPYRSLLESMKILEARAQPNGLKIEEILEILGSQCHPFLILMLAIPFVQPVPLLGFSTPIGAMIAGFGLYYAIQRPPWLPQKIRKLQISYETIQKYDRLADKILMKTGRFIKPRYFEVFTHSGFRALHGILIAVFAILLALPLPVPFSNSIPAYFLVIHALGLLEKDGLFIGVSYLLAIAGGSFFVTIYLGTKHLLDFF